MIKKNLFIGNELNSIEKQVISILKNADPVKLDLSNYHKTDKLSKGDEFKSQHFIDSAIVNRKTDMLCVNIGGTSLCVKFNLTNQETIDYTFKFCTNDLGKEEWLSNYDIDWYIVSLCNNLYYSNFKYANHCTINRSKDFRIENYMISEHILDKFIARYIGMYKFAYAYGLLLNTRDSPSLNTRDNSPPDQGNDNTEDDSTSGQRNDHTEVNSPYGQRNDLSRITEASPSISHSMKLKICDLCMSIWPMCFGGCICRDFDVPTINPIIYKNLLEYSELNELYKRYPTLKIAHVVNTTDSKDQIPQKHWFGMILTKKKNYVMCSYSDENYNYNIYFHNTVQGKYRVQCDNYNCGIYSILFIALMSGAYQNEKIDDLTTIYEQIGKNGDKFFKLSNHKDINALRFALFNLT